MKNSLSEIDFKNLPYNEFVTIINSLSPDEIINLSNKIGYPIFTRLCMGDLKHKFILLQDGAAAIILNEKKEILLQRRTDRDLWGIPGGCQELGETFEDTIIREIREETNLIVTFDDLELITVVSGLSRKNVYPTGDIVINNTVLFKVESFSNTLKCNDESKELKFFSLDNLPINLMDCDLIEAYKKIVFLGTEIKNTKK